MPTTQITKINIRFGSTDSSSRHVLRLNFDVHVVLHLFYNFVQSANAIKMESHFTSTAVARRPHYTRRHNGVNKNLREHSYFNAHAFSRDTFALFELLLYDNQINLQKKRRSRNNFTLLCYLGLTIVSLPDVLSKDMLHRSMTVQKCKIDDTSMESS